MKLIIRVGVIMLMLGLTLPAKAVDDGNNVFYINQDVGIKDRTPSATLHVNGSSLFEAGNVTFSNTSPVTFNDLALVNSTLRIPTGANPGYVLTSDATGNASWTSAASLPSNGDNLGNHIATTDLDMSNNDINNVDMISANIFNGGVFRGDGSGLTGLSDNLGNHTATTDLDMSNNDINNVDMISANIFNGGVFRGDGSGLTGISGSNGTFNHIVINNPVINDGYLQDPTINGIATFTANSQAIINGGLRITTNPSDGYVLTSDADGNAVWALPASVSNGVINNTIIRNSTIKKTKIIDSDFINGDIFNTYIHGSYLQDPTINGVATFTENSIAIFQGELQIPAGGGIGKILASDAEGKAFWTVAAAINTNGDDLGNHTATRELNMSNKDISNVATITANRFEGGTFNGEFQGDGSGLTNVQSNIFKIVNNSIVNNGSEANLFQNNFIIGSLTTGNPHDVRQQKRMFFDKKKAAFRAGTTLQNQWNDFQVGYFSTAFGRNSIASGSSSIAGGNGAVAENFSAIAIGYEARASGPNSVSIGHRSYAPGNFAFAIGNQVVAAGHRSTAFGYKSRALGQGSTVFGKETLATSYDSFAAGQEAQALNTNSFALGKFVRSSGDQAFTMGMGISNQDMLENNIQNSMAIGFLGNDATLFVGPTTIIAPKGRVGIGTNTPQDLLDVDGKIRTKAFRMPTGAGTDLVLTSVDATGNAVWKSLGAIGGTGDNLGNHIATQDLNMSNNVIRNTKKVVIGESGWGQLHIDNPDNSSPSSTAYAVINKPDGYAHYGTLEKKANGDNIPKWEVGSYGDTRPNAAGRPNSFYIKQKTFRNDSNVPGNQTHRFHINDLGNIGIGTINQSEKLEVAGKIKTQCIILQDGTEICNKQDLIDIVNGGGGGDSYSWHTGNYGACNLNYYSSVGRAIKARAVTCQDQHGTVVDDSNCSGQKPPTAAKCNICTGRSGQYIAGVPGRQKNAGNNGGLSGLGDPSSQWQFWKLGTDTAAVNLPVRASAVRENYYDDLAIANKVCQETFGSTDLYAPAGGIYNHVNSSPGDNDQWYLNGNSWLLDTVGRDRFIKGLDCVCN